MSSENPPAEISRCLVYCRLRPTKPGELSEAGTFPLLTLTHTDINVHDEKNYQFDGTFDASARQEDLFEKMGKPCIDHAVKGFCSAILSYGQTGSGKTHSLVGRVHDAEQAGLVPRCADYLFKELDRRAEDYEFSIVAQFVQIYRDHLGDLMSESGNARVEIHWDAPSGVTLPGCSSHALATKDEFMALFESGYKNRVTVATAMNPESSRGHAALVVWISSKSKMQGNIEEKKGKVTFIDLAGYERFSKTGISNSDPVRKDEAKTINASLLSLGHVVTALSNNEKHVPWRNSKLTRLLQDSIGGRSRTTILLTVGPSSDHLFETTNTLQFGQRAMAVKVQSKIKVVVDWEKHAKKLEMILEEKNKRIAELSQQLAGCVASESELILRQQRDIDSMREKHAEELAKLEEEGAGDDRLMTLRMQQNVEAELLFSQQAEERAYEEEAIEKEDEENNNNNNNNNNNDEDEVDDYYDNNNETDQKNNKNRTAVQEQDQQNGAEEQQEGASPSVPRLSLHQQIKNTPKYPNNSNNNDNNTNNVPTTTASTLSPNPGEVEEVIKAKDEMINDLKKQVRLFKMKLLVPEKYRGTSEAIEHEVLTSRRGRSESLSRLYNNNSDNNNNNNNICDTNNNSSVALSFPNASQQYQSQEFLSNNNNNNNVVSREEYDAMKRTLENEIDNRDQLLASKLDLRSFASYIPAVNEEPGHSSATSLPLAIKQTDSDQEKERKVGAYIASLQRRVQDLNERLVVAQSNGNNSNNNNNNNRNSNNNNNNRHQSQSQSQAETPRRIASAVFQHENGHENQNECEQQLPRQQTAFAVGITPEEATRAIQESHLPLLTSLQQLIVEAKQSFADATLDFTSNVLAEQTSLSEKLHNQTQFLQTELDTAKMEMEMALEGQNESLMQAIESARAETVAKFNIEKLSWEEDSEDRVSKAVQAALAKEKNSFGDSILLLQGENARLKNEIDKKDGEIKSLKVSLVESEARHEDLLSSTQQKEAAAAAIAIATAAAAGSKTSSTNSVVVEDTLAVTPTAEKNKKTTISTTNLSSMENEISKDNGNINSSAVLVNERQHQQRQIMQELDSVLMPVLKNKTQLLDDITEVLVSVTASAMMEVDNGSFDHIPEIPLISARVGTTTNTNFASLLNTATSYSNNNNNAIDPHASLTNFVSMIQAQKQLQQQQRAAQALSAYSTLQQQHRNSASGQNLDDSFADDATGVFAAASAAHQTSSETAASRPIGIPSLNLGGLKNLPPSSAALLSPAIFSPGPSISVRSLDNNNLNQQQQQQQQMMMMMAGGGMMSTRSTSSTLPATLPNVMMRIVKRLRESSSDAETKWMKCVVALSKISRSISGLMSGGQQQQPQQQQQQQAKPSSQMNFLSSSGKNQTAASTASSASAVGVQVAKTASEIMGFINAALYDKTDSTTSGSANASKPPKSLNEAESARRALLKHAQISNGATLAQSTVAGETNMAEQQALQSVILSQKEELARTDEEVISLAVEVARAKLQLRFEKQLLVALEGDVQSGGEDDEVRRANVAELDEIGATQRQEAKAKGEELSYYRLKSVMLEQELRHKLAELARTNQGGSRFGGGGASGANAATTTTIPPSSSSTLSAASATNFASSTKLTRQVELEQIQREIHQASASIVTDMDLITSCREAELRVLSARLESCERELSSFKKDSRFLLLPALAAAAATGANASAKMMNSSSLPPSSVASGGNGGGSGGGVSSSAEAVFYHILRNLRKENSILHSVIRERGLQLRKYALTLMRHQLLPPSTDVTKLAGDVHSELRLAFAERDEEIFLKEQALNMRSTQVIVLEESLAALIDQLHTANMVPCRPNSRFAAELERTKDEIAQKLEVKNASREDIKSKIERIKTELERVDQKIVQQRAESGQGQETTRSAVSHGGGPVTTSAHAAQSSANDALLVLRLQKDHLTHAKNISEVQLGALESEMSILKQSLLSASSTVAIESAIETRDAEENASVITRLFRKIGGGK